MEKVVSDYLDFLRSFGHVPEVGDREIVLGRISLSVFPSVESDSIQRLFMDFPEDLKPEEAACPMGLKFALVGPSELPDFLRRIGNSLHSGKEHHELYGEWSIRCSEKGSMLSIEARRRT